MPDDVNINGSIDFSRKGGIRNRMMGRGTSHNVSASLKFDIPGLQDFKKQLTDINVALGSLDKTFAKLAKGPEAFSKQLESVVKQMKVLQAQQVQGNRFVTQGTPPQRDPVGQASAAAQAAGGPAPGVPGGGSGVPSGGGGGGGGGAGAAAIAQMVTKGIEAMMKRFDAGMQQGISADVYSSRMASYTGTSSAKNFKNQGKNGFGFLATDFVQGNEVQYQGTGIGAYVGAAGRPGQWGSAYTTSIRQAQELMPGLDASQAGNIQTSIYSNVQGIKLGQALLGQQASPYKSDGTGERKTQDEYFRDILNGLQRRPRTGGRPGGAWTKEDIMKQNFPGSRLNLTLATILPEDAIPAWFDWAINNAAAGGNLSTDPTQERKQLEGVRGGRSLATNAQETTNREAQKDATFAGQQYGAMNARLDYEKKMLDALQSIDTTLRHAYGATGRVPSLLQGLAANVAGGLVGGLAAGLLGGDPGYMPMGDPPAQPALRSGSIGGSVAPANLVARSMAPERQPESTAPGATGGRLQEHVPMGDPEGSTSHLTPDLRKRVNTMMSANPNLKISSAYRDNRRQQSLQGKGPFAPSGKSKHGRGQAVDFGTQLGWVAKNAHKFGLETAARYGEPWHVQLAGTTTMGDPIDPSAQARLTEAAMSESVISHFFAAWQAKQAQAGQATPSSSTGSGSATPGAGGAAADVGAPSAGGQLSADQVVKLLHNAGFTGDALVKMAGIANRESSWTPSAHRTDNKSRDDVGDFGLLQINYTHVPGLIKAKIISSVYDLLDPVKNAAAAFYLSGGGTNLSPWNAGSGGYNASGAPLNNVKQSALDQATAAAKANGWGDPGYASTSSAPALGYASYTAPAPSQVTEQAREYMGDSSYASSQTANQAREFMNVDTPRGDSNTSNTNTSIVGGTNVHFHNTFQLSFPNGATRQSIDTAARQIAQRLEPQISRLVSRTT